MTLPASEGFTLLVPNSCVSLPPQPTALFLLAGYLKGLPVAFPVFAEAFRAGRSMDQRLSVLSLLGTVFVQSTHAPLGSSFPRCLLA